MAIDYPSASAIELAAALAGREVSSLELFEAAVARIEAMDGPINAVVVRDFERGREAARNADAALARGERAPLLGVPITVKESFFTPGMPTTWGFGAFKGWQPGYESTATQRLKDAGAVLIGKTNVPVALADWQSNNPIYGRTNNPHDLSRTPGGSSGGSGASLAAGYVPLELGSDIGGSVRIPAHFCGVFGHKPTYNLVPLTGHAPPGVPLPGAAVDMVVVGPLARSAADLELAMDVLAGPDGAMAKGYRLDLPASRGRRIADFRILMLDHHPCAPVDDEVLGPLNALADRLAAAGAKVSRADEGLPNLARQYETYTTILNAVVTRGAPTAPKPIDAHEWMNALDRQAGARREWAALFEAYDVVLAPPIGVAAFPHDDSSYFDRTLTVNGEKVRYADQIAWPSMANYTGLPSTVAPIGKTAAGLPVGVQIIGPWLEDRTTLALARLIEELG